MQKNQRVVWMLGPSLRAGGTWFPPLSPRLAAAALPTPRQGWELLWCDYEKRKKDATSPLKVKKILSLQFMALAAKQQNALLAQGRGWLRSPSN